MASNRHLGRIIVLQTLYELSFRRDCGDTNSTIDEIVDRNISRYKATVSDIDFIKNLTKGIDDTGSDLDKRLQPLAPEWPLDQIAAIDHIVLRMGAYELINNSDVPPKVVINEAVELAKSFGGDGSSRFVNGVLGTLLKEVVPNLDTKATIKDTK